MFLLNSVMSMGNATYFGSRYKYDRECGIVTRNPMYVLHCDDSIIQRFSWVLFIMTFILNKFLIY